MSAGKDVLKRFMLPGLILFCTAVIQLAVFTLYGISLEPLAYSLILSGVLFLTAFLAELFKEKRRAALRARLLASCGTQPQWDSSLLDSLPESRTREEKDYREMLSLLGTELERQAAEFRRSQSDSIDYYTGWVHQIKTPIAVMKLKLAEDTPENRALSAELFRIEQYVEMVLQYVRLGSEATDLVIREYSADEIVRDCLRKFAPQFIEANLRLIYSPSDLRLVTDRKWFACILEQFLSNAVKYTPSGSVTVSITEEGITVSDTGIGIAPEDLPRIFEKGFTGTNGRLGRQSSGLGLYLAKKAADLLCITLRAESALGKGSTFSVLFPKP